jgi:hypothetical protein
MRRSSAVVGCAFALAVAAGCGVVPHDRSATILDKRAATGPQAASVVAQYAVVRAESAKKADVGHLADVESGTLLAIESTTYYVDRSLGVTPGAAAVGAPTAVWSGSFARYPLWFAAVAPAQGEKTQVAMVFTRRSSTDPWRAVMAPRLAADTDLPDVGIDDDGAAVALTRDEAAALSAPVTSLARHYADVLEDPRSPYADDFVPDSFITEMRQLVQAQPSEHIVFRQTWSADPVKYAFRLDDGGVLMFVDLHRDDYYTIQGKHALGFAGSQAAAFLPEPVHRHARLSYEHEVLLLAPGDGKPYAIGQFGGLVRASGR